MNAPTIAPAHPSERKVVATGFQAGRAARGHDACPYPLRKVDGRVVGRKALLWLRGYVEGEAELARVRRSYTTAVAALDGPQRNCWGGIINDEGVGGS